MVSSAKEHIYMHLQGQAKRATGEDGYAMAALLVTIAVMGVMMTMAMPTWRQQAQREKEAELIFRAGQYVHAIELYKRRNANSYPPNIDVLVKGRFLRKKYSDPMTKDGEFRLLTPQELNATPSRILQTGGAGATSGRAGTADSRLGSGTALTGQGLGSTVSVTPQTPGTDSPGMGSTATGSGSGSSSGSAFGGTGAFGQNGQIQNGPIAAVASKSTEQSIRIFKGRDHYNEWIVTIDDVVPRQFLRQPQTTPNQSGMQPGAQPGRPSTPGSPSAPIR
jgi:type II secretory pathway pseudopilin PulG